MQILRADKDQIWDVGGGGSGGSDDGPPGLGNGGGVGTGGKANPGKGQGGKDDGAEEPVAEDQYGIETLPSSLSTTTSSTQFGWEFQVGASDLTVSALRAYRPATDANALTLRLWRVSDSTLVASAELASVTVDTWAEAALGSDVTLTAGESYVVTVRRTDGGSSSVYWNGDMATSGAVFDDAITFTQARWIGSDAFPTTVNTSRIYGIPDIVFTTP